MTNFVWVFNGAGAQFPSGVFSSREAAETWIRDARLTGTLTAYPLDESVYDWGIREGRFKPTREYQSSPDFIGRFSSASQPHFHYENGECGD